MEKLLKQFNFSPPEILVFKSLLRNGGATVSEIAKATNMKRTSCQEIIYSLEEKSFIIKSKIGNKYFYQTEDPYVFAQITNERQFLVDKLIERLNQKSKHKSWSVRSITTEELAKLVRRAKKKKTISRSFAENRASLHILTDGRIILESKDEDIPSIEIKSQELAEFHMDLLKH